MIKAGSKVRVVDWGHNCSTFIDWFKHNADSLPIEYVARYAYGDSSNFDTKRFSDKTIYRVLYVAGCHALIEKDYSINGDKTYLVGITGLEECVDKSQVKDMLKLLKSMSISEIRELIDEIITDNED